MLKNAIRAFLMVCAAASTASAAEIRIDPAGAPGLEGIAKIVLTGKIVRGDVARVEMLAPNEDGAVIFLNSLGGDYREGLALARLFKQRRIRTVVAAGQSCMSACAIAFLGGSANGEEGSTPFARAIATTARLGFHAPFIEVGAGQLNPKQIEQAYDHAMRTVTDFVREARGLGISAEVAADMMTPQRADLYRIATVGDLVRAGIEVQGIPVPQSMTLIMAANLCLNGWLENTAGRGEFLAALAEMADLSRSLDWSGPTYVEVESGYFSAERVMVKRTVLPIGYAGEGNGYYSCMIDHAQIDGRLRVANRGYIFTETGDEIMDRAKSFGGPDFEELTQSDIASRFFIRAMDPFSPYESSQEPRLGVVPPWTPIHEVEALVKSYTATQPPL